jgi:hypothetical protein
MRIPPDLTREDLLGALDRVDVEGWNGPTATELLTHVRRYLVRPQVAARRLGGLAAAQAEATGWETAWELLSGAYLRTTENPMGVLWVAIRRAIRGEVVAARLATTPRRGWFWSPAGYPDDDPAELIARRVEEPLSLDGLMQTGFDVVAPPAVTPLGSTLDAVVGAMVEEGWTYSLARPAVEAVAANAGLGRSRSRTVGGWRTLAQGTGLPPWQLRRLTVLLCGAPGWRGLIEVILETGHGIVTHPTVRNAIRGTLNRRLAAPQSYTIGAPSSAPDRDALPLGRRIDPSRFKPVTGRDCAHRCVLPVDWMYIPLSASVDRCEGSPRRALCAFRGSRWLTSWRGGGRRSLGSR